MALGRDREASAARVTPSDAGEGRSVRQVDTVTPSDAGEAGGVEGSRRLFVFLCLRRSVAMTALTANGEIPRLAALARNDNRG